MPRDVKTFRITEFKGLNSSVNSQNIEDEEFSILTNAELTKGRTIQARKGYTELDTVTGSGSMSTIYKTYWDASNADLYYCDAHRLWKWVEGGDDTYISLAFRVGYTHPQLDRYKDRILVLFPGQKLKWLSSADVLNDAQYPVLQQASRSADVVVVGADGELEAGRRYEYCISMKFGADFRDGESCGSLPLEYEAPVLPIIVVPPGDKDYDPPDIIPPNPYWMGNEYIYGVTTNDNKKITCTNANFGANLNGFSPALVRLFRRMKELQPTDTWIVKTSWELIDEMYMSRDVGATTYTFVSPNSTCMSAADSSATYDSVNDAITLLLTFTDSGVTGNTSFKPRDISSEQKPVAKYMTRLYNRIFLANITSTQDKDKKLVWYSFRPQQSSEASELQGFLYDNPMLLFPPGNTFYCDMDNVEDEITAIHTFQDNVIIFTNNCMFVWREGMSDPAKMSSDVGCSAQHTICEFEGKLIWLSKNGVYTFDGTTLKNLSYLKVDTYIKSIAWAYAGRSVGCVHERRYWLTAPYGSGDNLYILVYDFDLDEWHVREYKYSSSESLYFKYIYSSKEGGSEVLYGSGISSGGTLVLAKMENGYADKATEITSTIKTKYLDFGAPDIQKTLRTLYLDFEDYTRGVTLDLYIDSRDVSKETITCSGTTSGLIVNSTSGGIVNSTTIANVSDEMLGFSLNRGLRGSRVQLAASFLSYGAPTKLHAIAFDWRPSHKVKRRYGDGS